MAGLMDLKSMMQSEAISGTGKSEAMKQEREMIGEQMDVQSKQQTMSAVGSGAMIGASVGGPVGAVIGAGVGFLADSLF